MTRTPTLLHFVKCATANPRQKYNKMKTAANCLPMMLFAVSLLLNLFCDELNSTKKIISVILKRGGAKKRLFKTFSSLNLCMTYKSTTTLFKNFGKEFDAKILEWKKDVEEDHKIDSDIINEIESAHVANKLFEGKFAEDQLIKHRETMHPGYQFVGDNVDFVVKVRHMSSSHRNKDHHLYHIIAYKNRLPGNNYLTDIRQVTDLNAFILSDLLPSPQDNVVLVDDFTHHVLHIWAKNIPAIQFCLEHIEPHIQHPNLDQTKKSTEKVRLGVLVKNESKIDDMVDICQFMHKYVPGHSMESTEMPVKCLSGGDYLTFERHKKAQSIMQDSRTPSERLMGLIPKFEEFHTQAEVNKVVWTLLYDTASSADIGTLYAARNAIDARNVTKDPGDNFYAASALIDKYTEALVTAGGVAALKMASCDSEIPSPVCDQDETDKFEYIQQAAMKFVKSHCVPDVPDVTPSITQTEYKCTQCQRTYARLGNLRRHETAVHNMHNIESSAHTGSHDSASNIDYKYNYTRCALPILMLRHNHNNAIKFADGDRLERCHKFFIPYYKVTSCPKYAYATLEYVTQLRYLLSPKQAFRLKWNRTANSCGTIDANFPLDLDVEHENKVFKEHITTYRGEVTESIIDTVSRSVDTSETIAKNFDKVSAVHHQSGRHVISKSQEDVSILTRQYIAADLYSVHQGRAHATFPAKSSNPFEKLSAEDFKRWIKQSVKGFNNKHYYA